MTDSPTPRPFNRPLTEALDHARREAAWRGLPQFGPELYLEALLTRKQGLPVRVLRNLNVPLDRLTIDLLQAIQAASGPDAPASPPVADAHPNPDAESALAFARDLARRMDLPWVGLAHLFLALLAELDSIPARLLAGYGVDLAAARAETERCLEADGRRREARNAGRGQCFSPLLQELLRIAEEEARLWRWRQIEPEHLLGAMLRKGQGDAVGILRRCGVDLSDLAIHLETMIDVGEETPSGMIETSYMADQLLELTGDNARRLGHPLAGSEHLLLAMIQSRTLPRRVLADFHIEEIRVVEEIGRLAGLRPPASAIDAANVAAEASIPPAAEIIALDSPRADAPPLRVPIVQTPEAAGLPLPAYETADSSGMDLRAAIPEDAPVVLQPGSWALVPTGLKVAIPHGHEGQIRARSGLAAKHGIGVLNGPGTIDADYRGEIKIILFNFSTEPFTIRRGERIAQLVFARTEQLAWLPTDSLSDTQRGSGGFGHTGK